MSGMTNQTADKEHGLLWPYHLDGLGHGQQVPHQDAVAALPDSPGFFWCHLQCDNPAAIQWMHRTGLDENIIEAMTADATRPRTLAVQDDGILIVLRGVNTTPDADPEDLVSLRIWLTKYGIISARKRQRRLLSIEDVRLSIEAGQGPKTPSEFLVQVIERIADRIGQVVDGLDEHLSAVETDLAETNASVLRQRLTSLRRQAAALRRYLAPQRDALDLLFRHRDWLSDDDAYVIREQADRMTRYVEDLDLARERALVLQEELQNRVAEQQNARMYLLSLVTAVFLPLSFLTGVFGMNVAGLPGTENPVAFVVLAVGMGAIALGMILYMRWRRWL